MDLVISILDVAISAIFAVLVLQQWIARRKPQQLLWGLAFLVWAVAVSAELAATLEGRWAPLTYRFYYAFGALMVAPWLGAGSIFLTASRRKAVAFFILVATLSLVGAILVFSYAIDPSLLTRTDLLGFVEVKVFPFIPVRILIVIGNILGTLAFVGSALISVWNFRKRITPRDRMLGVLLIGIGGLVAAASHSIGALGGPGLFRISELAAIGLIFGGYALSVSAVPQAAKGAEPVKG